MRTKDLSYDELLTPDLAGASVALKSSRTQHDPVGQALSAAGLRFNDFNLSDFEANLLLAPPNMVA